MKLAKGSSENLRLMGEWKTIRAVAAERHILGVSIRERIVKLAEAGLLDVRTVQNPSRAPNSPHTIKEYKRTPAGDEALAEYDLANPCKKTATPSAESPKPERNGNNPFEWRTYAQPVIAPYDQYANMNKPDTSNSKLKSYTI